MCLTKLCFKQLSSGDCFRQKRQSTLINIKKGMKEKSLGQLRFYHLGHLDYSDNTLSFPKKRQEEIFQSSTSFCKRTTPSSLYKFSSTPKFKQNSALNLSHEQSSAKLWLTRNPTVLLKLLQNMPSSDITLYIE